MKILFYCQHVLGVGHFLRSMEIARAFVGHEVLFVEGGTPPAGYKAPSHVQRVFLPSIMMDPSFSHLETGGRDLETLKVVRRRKLFKAFDDFKPDVIIIEFFPFGRKAFGFEILPLLERARRQASPPLVVCSVRDILVEKSNSAKYEARVLQWLKDFFDLVVVHSDPRILCLDETFSRVEDIPVPLVYSGYVARRLPGVLDPPRVGHVVASTGGGRVGVDFVQESLAALRRITNSSLRLKIFIGPYLPEDERRKLVHEAHRDPRVSMVPFSPHFIQEMAQSELSLSMAGYNTCMDILSTGVKALVFPFPQNREQALRARKLASLGFMKVVDRPNRDVLRLKIEQALSAPWPKPRLTPDLDGARKTVATVEKFWAHR